MPCRERKRTRKRIARYWKEATHKTKAEHQKGKPPKAWWDECVSEVSSGMPEYTNEQVSSVCGWRWFTHPEKGKHSLPPRGTGIKTGDADERKKGVPRTEKEREERHKAKYSGLAQIPAEVKKRKEGDIKKYRLKLAKFWKARHSRVLSHNKHLLKNKKARHSNIGMKEYAVLDVNFLREGDFNTMGTPYHYSWDVIEANKDSFKGREFYINHSDITGTEYGIINEIYTKLIDGIKWLCAKIKIPETKFTQNFLERVENGLIREISSTHDFQADEQKNVKFITGSAISAVNKGEVEGAKIQDIERNVKSSEYKKQIRGKLAKVWERK